MIVQFKKLITTASPPTKSHGTDAGFDLTFLHFTAQDNGVINFHTGIAVEIPDGYFGLLRPRSSVRNTGYVMASSGVIDSGFRGEIVIPLRKVGAGRDYDTLERVCQLIILPLPRAEFVEVAELGESERGSGGFGSSGV